MGKERRIEDPMGLIRNILLYKPAYLEPRDISDRFVREYTPIPGSTDPNHQFSLIRFIKPQKDKDKTINGYLSCSYDVCSLPIMTARRSFKKTVHGLDIWHELELVIINDAEDDSLAKAPFLIAKYSPDKTLSVRAMSGPSRLLYESINDQDPANIGFLKLSQLPEPEQLDFWATYDSFCQQALNNDVYVPGLVLV